MKKNLRSIKTFLIGLIVTAIAGFSTGCNQDDPVTQVGTNQQAENMDFSTTTAAGQPVAGVLVLTDVKVLVKDIKLNVAGHEDGDCNFKVGPFIIHLDLTNSVNVMSTSVIPPGTYDKVKFEIHKLQDNEIPPDPDFMDMLGRYSVVVRGTYSGTAFIFKSGVSAHQKLTFPHSLFVSIEGKSNITLSVKPYSWFVNDAGLFIDPTIETNASIISRNIRENINENFKIFIDNNRDGDPD